MSHADLRESRDLRVDSERLVYSELMYSITVNQMNKYFKLGFFLHESSAAEQIAVIWILSYT